MMKIKDIIAAVFIPLAMAFICYNDYQISQEMKELNQNTTEYLEVGKKEAVRSVIDDYYAEHPMITPQKVKSLPAAKKTAPANTQKVAKRPQIRTKAKPIKIDIHCRQFIDEIAEYIKKKEGFRAHAYKDNTQYSIGYGTKATSSTEVITVKEANIRLYKHIKTVIIPAFDGVSFQSIEQVHSAIDFSYNLGHNRFRQKIVNEDGTIDCAKMMAYNKMRDKNGNLVYNEGLAQRRMENFIACSAFAEIK